MGKVINKIPGSRLLISSLPGSALRMHKPCLVNLVSKDTHLVFSMYLSKPRDVNKRSKSLAW